MERKNIFETGGGLPYTAPQLEQFEITAEQGFAASWGDGSLEDNENDLGDY